ncbi:MAG: hypothetical protein KAR79_03935 [Simkaniaceae bacterium]|nr:hypothetical protein [Simkaniaceae bacterium]
MDIIFPTNPVPGGSGHIDPAHNTKDPVGVPKTVPVSHEDMTALPCKMATLAKLGLEGVKEQMKQDSSIHERNTKRNKEINEQ